MSSLHSITVTAHRGNSAYAPENTMAAFTQALDLEVHAIETDIRLTRDGVPVLIHDSDLTRTASLDTAVAAMTLAEIQRVDVGAWMGAQFRGETVPALADLARRCRDKARLVLDLKADGAASAIADSLADAGMPQRQVAVCTWSMAQATDVIEHLPEAKLIFIESPLEHPDPQWFRSMSNRGFHGLSLNVEDVSETLVTDIHQAGLTVFVWTVNDATAMRATLRTGVDGIITDDPARLHAACRDTPRE